MLEAKWVCTPFARAVRRSPVHSTRTQSVGARARPSSSRTGTLCPAPRPSHTHTHITYILLGACVVLPTVGTRDVTFGARGAAVVVHHHPRYQRPAFCSAQNGVVLTHVQMGLQ